MNKYLLLLFFLVQNTFSLELKCDFEEVYQDGSTQQGFLLLANQKLRYQYHYINLFTILGNQQNFYIVENNNKEKFQKISPKPKYLEKLVDIAKDYPAIEDLYEEEEFTLMLEKSENGLFLRLIGIISSNIKMSIYLNTCEEQEIENKYFNFFPFFDYNS